MIDREFKDAVRKSWNESSGMYDHCPGHGIGKGDEKDAWMQELSRNLPGPLLRVLDVGCGTGAMSLLFAGMGHQVTGLDLSEGMMAKARGKADAENLLLELRTGDAEHLPFDDESFDVVVNRHLLWTLPHPEIALKEWHRVLKNGGVVLIIEGIWTDRRFLSRAKRHLSNGLARIFGQTHGGHYDEKVRSQLPCDGGMPEETLVSYLDHAGFTGICVRDLMHIRELQKRELPWYQRFAPAMTYYLVAATKMN